MKIIMGDILNNAETSLYPQALSKVRSEVVINVNRFNWYTAYVDENNKLNIWFFAVEFLLVQTV